MKKLIYSLVGAMFLFVSCQSDGLQIDEASKSDNANVTKERTIEFKSYKGVIVADPNVSDNFLQEGGGTATHIGKYTFVNTSLLSDFVGSFEGKLTTAVGDQIYYDTPFIACADGKYFFCPGVNATFTYEIRGGTGRFENASGTMTFEGTFVAGGPFEATGSAEITYNVNVNPE